MGSSRSRRSSSSRKRASEEELVKIEIDAAEALAEFSKSCLPPSGKISGVAPLRWLVKRRRSSGTRVVSSWSRMRVVSNSAVDFPLSVKDESQSEDGSDKEPRRSGMPPVAYNRFETSDDSLDPAESPSSPLPQLGSYSGYVKSELGLVQHSAFHPALDSDDAKPSRWSGKHRGKVDRKRAAVIKTSGRTSRALTEEEKELRRVRRIEANRESARQTIRRKQKICEEMTSKANELSSENERIRKEIASVRVEIKRMFESSCSLRKQLEMANMCVPPLASSEGSGSDECSRERDQTASSGEPMIQRVQVNRQDDNLDSIEFVSAPALETRRSCSSPGLGAGALNRPLQQQTLGGHGYNPHFAFAKMMVGGNGASRAFFQPGQQGMYSFYPGKSIAAENRRRRKELKQTRLYSRQVSLNT